MTVGVYGGSFDPVHIGHVAIAAYAAEHGSFGEVWMMVSPLNPLKGASPPLFSDSQRLEMTRRAMSGVDRVTVSDFEMGLPRPSYSFLTLSRLKEQFPDRKFRLITGADNLRDFHLWRNPGELLRQFGLTVFPRPGIEISPRIISDIENRYQAPGSIVYLEKAPLVDVSSTMLRKLLVEPEDHRLDRLVPAPALSFIRSLPRNTFQRKEINT